MLSSVSTFTITSGSCSTYASSSNSSSFTHSFVKKQITHTKVTRCKTSTFHHLKKGIWLGHLLMSQNLSYTALWSIFSELNSKVSLSISYKIHRLTYFQWMKPFLHWHHLTQDVCQLHEGITGLFSMKIVLKWVWIPGVMETFLKLGMTSSVVRSSFQGQIKHLATTQWFST